MCPTWFLSACFVNFPFVVSRKKDRTQCFYRNYGKSHLAEAQQEQISPSQDMCTRVTSRGPIKGRDDKRHLSVVSLSSSPGDDGCQLG